MPRLISTTGEIGVREHHEILFLAFQNVPESKSLVDEPWERIPERQTVIQWQDQQGIGWKLCLHCSPGTLSTPYRGEIYLDVAPQEGSECFERLLALLEDVAGRCRFDGVDFWAVLLGKSQKWYEQRHSRLD